MSERIVAYQSKIYRLPSLLRKVFIFQERDKQVRHLGKASSQIYIHRSLDVNGKIVPLEAPACERSAELSSQLAFSAPPLSPRAWRAQTPTFLLHPSRSVPGRRNTTSSSWSACSSANLNDMDPESISSSRRDSPAR